MKSGPYAPKTGRKRMLAATTVLAASLSLFMAGCNHGDDGGGGATNVTPTLQLVAQDFSSPVTAVEAPDNSGRLFVVDQTGQIWVILPDGRKLAQPFLNLAGSMVQLKPGYDERGLLGLAFHPDFKTNRKFYVYYSAPSNGGGPAIGYSWDHINRVSEFRVTGSNPNVADPGSERIVLEENAPQFNHNGGTIAFGPEGYLYISMGDGGNKDDVGAGHVSDWYAANQGGNAQNLSANLLGKILRINVNTAPTYSIPADNPFVQSPTARGEIYAYGFRNPYRFSFDMGGNHELYEGDAGQSLYEEINLVTKGGNYGWNVKEGDACFNTDNDVTTRPGCPSADPLGVTLSDPIIKLPNAANPAGGIATVVIGGYVYRGNTFPQLQGSYIFGTYSQHGGADGKVYSAPEGSTLRSFANLDMAGYPNNVGQYIKGMGQDRAGEIYVLTSAVQGPTGSTGRVYKIVAAP